MNNKLTSIAEHSDWLSTSTYDLIDRWKLHRKRVEFGKQPLALWMFVPCKLVDGVWVVIPDKENHFTRRELEEYEEAKNRCLFEGFTSKDGIVFTPQNQMLIQNSLLEKMTVENIVDLNLELTDTAQKQLFGSLGGM